MPQARAIGPTVVPRTLDEALEADVIFLAVRFDAHRAIASALPNWRGKTLIDAMNTNDPVESLDGLPSSAFVAKAFPGVRLVKGFNHLLARTLASGPAVEGRRRVVFLSGDDEAATAEVAGLATRLGFAPVNLGQLDEGGTLVQARGRAWGPLIFQDLFKNAPERAVAAAAA